MQTFISHYQEFSDKIYNYFLYRVNFNQAVAEDLTSEVFLKAYEKYDTFDQERSFQAWIYTIAHNHLVNHYSHASRKPISLEGLEDFIQTPNDNHFEEKHEAGQVLQVIDNMQENDRDVLRFRFVDELDYWEIADILQKEEGAIRTQVSRSLEKLRQILKKNLEK